MCRGLVILLPLVLLCSGCGSTDEPQRLSIGPPGGSLQGDTQAQGQVQPWGPGVSRQNLSPGPRSPNTVFRGPREAERCPEIEVTGSTGRTSSMRPFRQNTVTLVVCWSVQLRPGRAVAGYAQQLYNSYSDHGLRVVGLATRTPDGYAPIGNFLQRAGIEYPVYVCGPVAFRKLASAAGSRPALLSFFLIDGNGLVRFYRRGFRFSAAGPTGPGAAPVRWVENAPPGDRVEDYVRGLLSELEGQPPLPSRGQSAGGAEDRPTGPPPPAEQK